MPDPFEEILWKIRWSEQHFKVLQKTTMDFLVSPFYDIRSETYRKNWFVIKVTEVEPMPYELALLIGDTVHNLRSALDHLIWLFAHPTKPGQEIQVQFPIQDRGWKFRRDRNRMMPGVPRRVRAAVERLQPYHRRKWPETALLSHIKEIDNWDKHRAPSMVAAFIEDAPVQFTSTGSTTVIRQKTFRGWLIPGAVLARGQMSKAPEDPKLTVSTKLVPVPVFDDRMPKEVRGLPVLETLREAGRFVRHEVVPLFRPLL